MTLREKIILLMDAGFEFGTSAGFILSPSEDENGGSQAIFNAPAPKDKDGFEGDPVFKRFSELEAVVDDAVTYAQERGLVPKPPSTTQLLREVSEYLNLKSQPRSKHPDESTSRKLHCLTCGKVIVSLHRHDFRTCNCGHGSGTQIFIDGGSDYIRWGAEESAKYKWVDSITEKDGE